MPYTMQFARLDGGTGTVTPVGTTLAGAPVLANAVNICPATAGNTAVALPQNSGGVIVVRNSAASAVTLTVFPPTSAGSINGGTAGAALSLTQGQRAVFFPHSNGVDYTALISA